ncbi:MAG: hypothetical protein K0S46_2710 [Moraxellaceae bacterium]|jgi:hypothetical protein|nr:hypothetical protein [Moraxellaceae bacterium]
MGGVAGGRPCRTRRRLADRAEPGGVLDGGPLVAALAAATASATTAPIPATLIEAIGRDGGPVLAMWREMPAPALN